MTQVLPAADWADDALRPSLIMILRRLDKVFLKIAKKPSIRVSIFYAFCLTVKKGVICTGLKYVCLTTILMLTPMYVKVLQIENYFDIASDIEQLTQCQNDKHAYMFSRFNSQLSYLNKRFDSFWCYVIKIGLRLEYCRETLIGIRQRYC